MNYLDYLTTGFSAAWKDAGDRWTKAKAGIPGGAYTADMWVKDALAVWLKTVRPLWNVWAVGMDVEVPVVGFNVTYGDAGKKQAFAAILPPFGTLPPVLMTDLLMMGGAQKVPGGVDATAKVTDCVLEVDLKNLGALPIGNYQGAVYLAGAVNRMIALVHLVIT